MKRFLALLLVLVAVSGIAATNRTPILRGYLQSNLDGAGYAGTNFYVGQTNVMGPATLRDVLTWVGTNSAWTNLYLLDIASATNLIYTVLRQRIIDSTNQIYLVMPVVKAGTNVLVTTNTTAGVKQYSVELNSTVWNLINTKAGTNNPTLYGMVVYGDSIINGPIYLGDNVVSNTVGGNLRVYNGGLESYADLVPDVGGIMYIVARLNVTNLVGVISTDNLPGNLPDWSLLSTNNFRSVVAAGTYITITTNTAGGCTVYTITGTPGTNPAPTGVITWDIAGGPGRNGDVRMDRPDVTNVLTGTITNDTTGNAATATHAITADYLLQSVISNRVSMTNILQGGANSGDAIKWNGTTWAATSTARDIPTAGTAISITTNAGANNTYSIGVSGLSSNEIASATDSVYRQRDIPTAGTNVVVVVTNAGSGISTYALSIANLTSNEVAAATDSAYRMRDIPVQGTNSAIVIGTNSGPMFTYSLSLSGVTSNQIASGTDLIYRRESVVSAGTSITVTTNEIGNVTEYIVTGTPGTPPPTGVSSWAPVTGIGRTGDVRMGSNDVVIALTFNPIGYTDSLGADGSVFVARNSANGLLYKTGFTLDNGGKLTGGSFAGNGADLNNLNASNLASGTVPLARLSGITSNQIATATDSVYRQRDIPTAGANVVVVTNTVGTVSTYQISAPSGAFTGISASTNVSNNTVRLFTLSINVGEALTAFVTIAGNDATATDPYWDGAYILTTLQFSARRTEAGIYTHSDMIVDGSHATGWSTGSDVTAGEAWLEVTSSATMNITASGVATRAMRP